MDMSSINRLAVAAATVAAFILGGLWYSPALFGKAWMKANGFTAEDLEKNANMAKVFGFSFIFTLIMAINLAMFLAYPEITFQVGAMYGFFTGFGWIAMGIGIVALFERKSWSYILINGGYMTVALLLMGAILGAWR